MITPPYSAEELEALGREHACAFANDGYPMCDTCCADWPCPTARLLVTVAEAQKQNVENVTRAARDWAQLQRESEQQIRALRATVEAKDIEVQEVIFRHEEMRTEAIKNLLGQIEAKDAEIAAIARDRDFWRDGEKRRFADLRAVAAEKESIREQLRQQTERADAAESRDALMLRLDSLNAKWLRELRAENAALKADVRQIVSLRDQLQQATVRMEERMAHIESLRSTIEAQGQELERLTGNLRVVVKADNLIIETLTAQTSTKDAILRECAETLRDLRSPTVTWRETLAAKCEAAIGEK